MKQKKKLVEIIDSKYLDDEIVWFCGDLEVKKMGNSGHVVLPKALVGKKVQVVFDEQ